MYPISTPSPCHPLQDYELLEDNTGIRRQRPQQQHRRIKKARDAEPAAGGGATDAARALQVGGGGSARGGPVGQLMACSASGLTLLVLAASRPATAYLPASLFACSCSALQEELFGLEDDELEDAEEEETGAAAARGGGGGARGADRAGGPGRGPSRDEVPLPEPDDQVR